jgi:transcriptional regulator with XRE-family HTH domain
VSSPSSSVEHARKALGLRLRQIRIDAGITARELGRRMGRHPSKVSRAEHGVAPPSADDIRIWCEHCGAADQVPDLIASLEAVEGMWVEWRQMERTGLRQAQESVRPLYERSRRFRVYCPTTSPRRSPSGWSASDSYESATAGSPC